MLSSVSYHYVWRIGRYVSFSVIFVITDDSLRYARPWAHVISQRVCLHFRIEDLYGDDTLFNKPIPEGTGDTGVFSLPSYTYTGEYLITAFVSCYFLSHVTNFTKDCALNMSVCTFVPLVA